jgi:hypothetical protein
MRFELTSYSLTAIREENDQKFYGRYEARGESRLLYHIKNALNENGFDLIKTRMWKDGHMVSDMQQYLRTKNPRSNTPHVMIYSPFWMVRGAEEDWNRGQVTLQVITDCFERQDDCADRLREIARQSDTIIWSEKR